MFSIKILQNCTNDLFHSTVLSFEKKQYLFNCSDGTQRNAIDQNIKLNKISNIFFNSSSVDAYLGTYGFTMTRSEQVTTQLIAQKTNMNNKQLSSNIPDKLTMLTLTQQDNQDKQDKNKPIKQLSSNLPDIDNKLKKQRIEDSPPEKNPFLWGPPHFSKNFESVKGFFIDYISDYIKEYDVSQQCFFDNNNNKIQLYQPLSFD